MKQSIKNIYNDQYVAHWLHSNERLWPQSNCYVDLWIEALHTLELNPIACFAFTLTTDFEGDQWTFFKVPLHDLFLLYGIDVQELNIWQSLQEHVYTQVSRDRLVLMEVDAFYLPDVSDTSYRQAHEKTTIGVQAIDLANRHLGYFHNSGYYTLHDTDFDGVFHIGEQAAGPDFLPPYVEFAKFDRLVRRTDKELAALAANLLQVHLARRPTANPFSSYREHFQEALAAMSDLDAFHKYAFATLRQYGACYEYAALFLQWLATYQDASLRKAARSLEEISGVTQTFLLKTARSVRTKKPFEYLPLLQTMETCWTETMDVLCSVSKESM